MKTATNKKLYLLLLLLLLVHFYSPAQVCHSRSFEIEEDQPSLTVRVVFKDHTGLLWIGTANGLYRFNGLRAQRVSLPGDSLPELTALGEDAGGTLWAGFSNGAIVTVRNGQATWFRPEEGLPKVAITGFFCDNAHRTWFSTAGEGIYYQQGRHLYNINTQDGLTDNYVYTLAGDTSGTVVAGTDRGISIIRVLNNRKEIRVFTGKNGLPDNITRTITPSDIAGYWWIGMQDKGVCLFDAAKLQLVNNHVSALWKHGQVNDIADLGSELWIATEEQGIWVYDKVNHLLQQRLFNEALPAVKINDLQPDNEGNIWLASSNRIVRTTGNHLLFYPRIGNRLLRNINALANTDGHLWMANESELIDCDLQNNSELRPRIFNITKGQAAITCLYSDAQGYIWVGTMGRGLIRMHAGTGKHRPITENPLLKNGHILSITGNAKTIWVASLNGVAELSLTAEHKLLAAPFSYRNYGKADGIGSDYVYHLYNDAQNRLWLATDGAGVALYEHGRFRNMFGEKQLKTNVVYAVAADNKGTTWFNTLNNGIFRYDGARFYSVTAADGLSDINITSFTPDNAHNLVLMNKKGIDIYDTESKKVLHFGKESGIVSGQAALNVICTDEQGRIWLGMESGLVRYSPFSGHQTQPQVYIEKVEIFNKAIDTGQSHVYKYDENNFRFVLTGLWYTDPEKLKYQYYLTRYNNKWETTSDNNIVFPQLRDGNYKLILRASVTGSFENAPERVFEFTIKKPFWRQWWFALLLVLGGTFLLYMLVRRRVKKIQKDEQVKNERFRLEYDTLKSQVNPHFLFNSFNALLGVIEDNPAEAGVFVQQLSAFYRKMTAYRDKDIISVNEELQMLETYLFIQQKRYGQALQATINVPYNVRKSKALPPLSLQLLAENAVKHNVILKETPLQLEVIAEGDYLVVRNTIHAKIKKEEGAGLGLQNITNRFRMLTRQPVLFENNNNMFTVKIPLINMSSL